MKRLQVFNKNTGEIVEIVELCPIQETSKEIVNVKLDEIFDDVQKWNERDLAKYYFDDVSDIIERQISAIYRKGKKNMISLLIDKRIFRDNDLLKCIVQNRECPFNLPLIQEFCRLNSTNIVYDFDEHYSSGRKWMNRNIEEFSKYMNNVTFHSSDVQNLSLSDSFHFIVPRSEIWDLYSGQTVNLTLLCRIRYTEICGSGFEHIGATTLETVVNFHPINRRNNSTREINSRLHYIRTKVQDVYGNEVFMNTVGFEEYQNYVRILHEKKLINVNKMYKPKFKYKLQSVIDFFDKLFPNSC